MEPTISCRTCNNYFPPKAIHEDRQTARFEEPIDWAQDGEPIPPFEETMVRIVPCPKCRTPNVVLWSWVDYPPHHESLPAHEVIWPKRRVQVPDELPDKFEQDYREAWEVLETSPRAAAMLGRRLLERVLEDRFDCKSGSLKSNVNKVINDPDADLTPALRQNLDVIRTTGNFAGHQQTDQATEELIDLDESEAEFTLQLVKELIDHVYVRPEQLRRQRRKFQEKVERTYHQIQEPASEDEKMS